QPETNAGTAPAALSSVRSDRNVAGGRDCRGQPLRFSARLIPGRGSAEFWPKPQGRAAKLGCLHEVCESAHLDRVNPNRCLLETAREERRRSGTRRQPLLPTDSDLDQLIKSHQRNTQNQSGLSEFAACSPPYGSMACAVRDNRFAL